MPHLSHAHAEKKGHRSLSSLTKSPAVVVVVPAWHMQRSRYPSTALTCHVCMAVCTYCIRVCTFVQCCTYATAIHCPPQHSQKRHRPDPTAASSSSAAAASTTTPKPHPPNPALPFTSVTPHAFDEFVRSNKSVPCVHRAVCTVPYRAVGVSICKKAPAVICQLRSPDGASVRAATLQCLALWLAHSAGQASGAQPSHLLLAAVRSFRSADTLHYCYRCCWLAPETGRRPDRPQRASQARKREQSKQSPGTGGAVAKPPLLLLLLLSLPSRPSVTYHAAPKLAHAMGPRKELEQREGSYRRVVWVDGWVCE